MKDISAANIQELNSIVSGLKEDPDHIKIGWLGSRRFILDEGSRSINDIYAAAVEKSKDANNPEELNQLFQNLLSLDAIADEKLHKTKMARLLHFIPSAWGRIFFDRDKAKATLLLKLARLNAIHNKVNLEDFNRQDIRDLTIHFTTLQKWYQKVEDMEAQGKTFSDTEESREFPVRKEITNAFLGIKEILEKKCVEDKDLKDADFDVKKMYSAVSEICKRGKESLYGSSVYVLELTPDGLSKESCLYFRNNCAKMIDKLQVTTGVES